MFSNPFLRNRNIAPEVVHINMVFEDEKTLSANPIIRDAIRATSPVLNGLRFRSLSAHDFHEVKRRLGELIGQRTQGISNLGTEADANAAKCALTCLKTMHEHHSWCIKQRGYEVQYNLCTQVGQYRYRGAQQNRDENELNYFTWLVDTDGLNFRPTASVSDSNASDGGLHLLNQTRSITVRPLQRFINVQARTESQNHRDERVLYQGQHPSQFSLTGSYAPDPGRHDFVQQWESLRHRRERIERYGSDHLVIFLHPNSERLEFRRDESIRGRMFERLATSLEDVKQQVHYSAIFDRDGEKRSDNLPSPPIFRATQQEACAFVAGRLAHPNTGLFFAREVPIRRFFSCYSTNHDADWEGSCLQVSLYFRKYKNRPEDNHKTFPWDERTETIQSDDEVESLLSTFKYTVRKAENSQTDATERQVVWNRPHRCNGMTQIRIDALPEAEQARVVALYGRGYGGYKPCERLTHKHRCAAHQQQGPRGYYGGN